MLGSTGLLLGYKPILYRPSNELYILVTALAIAKRGKMPRNVNTKRGNTPRFAKNNRIMRGTGLLIKNDEFAEPQIKG